MKTTTKAMALIIVIVVGVLVYFGWTWLNPPAAPKGGTLILGTGRDPIETLDPRLTWKQMYPYIPIMFEQVFQPDLTEDGELKPLLCTSWERLDDDVTYIFHIREGVKFHDGTEMTAEDWKYTFDEYRTVKPGVRPGQQFQYCRFINETEVVDKYTFKFKLMQPMGEIPSVFRLGTGEAFIIPKNACETLGEAFRWNPVGTGPYKFVEYVEGEYVKYERFDDYWRGTPNLDFIIVKVIPDSETRAMALESGEVDVLHREDPESIPVFEQNPNIEYWDDLYTDTHRYTAFNLRLWPTNSLKFRKAVHMAINYSEILPVVNPYGEIIRQYGFLHNCFVSGKNPWAYTPAIEGEFPEYDLDAAKQLMEEVKAEAPIPKLLVCGQQDDQRWIEYLGTLLNLEFGLEVDVQILQGPEVMDMMMNQADKWHMHTAGWLGGSPVAFMSSLYGSKGGVMPDKSNFAGYANADVDENIGIAAASVDEEDIANYYYLAESQAVKDLTYIWPYHRGGVLAYRSDLVGDIKPCKTGFMIYIYTDEVNVYKKE